MAWNSIVKTTLIALIVTTLSGCTQLLFYPQKAWVQNPMKQGLSYQDIVLIHANGQRIHGWWIPAQHPKNTATNSNDMKMEAKGTVYFLHGNAENISTHLMNVRWLPEKGYNLFLIDYRGYGLSDADPSLQGALEDIELGLSWLVQSGKSQDTPIVVFGQSLGAAMSTYVVAQPPLRTSVRCVMLEAAFTGYPQIAKDVASRSLLLWPFQWLIAASMPNQWNPIDHIANIEAPKLIMHSSDDKIIPFTMGKELFAAATEPKQFITLRGPHISGPQSQAVKASITEFLDSCSQAAATKAIR